MKFQSLFLICFVAFPLTGKAFSLEFIRETQIAMDVKEGATVGGLSGGAFRGNENFVAIADDRGSFGGPRLIEFKLNSKKEFQWTKNVLLSEGVESSLKKPVYFDGEGLVSFPEFYVLSSEGDNNAKPRKAPRLVEVSLDGKLVKDLPLPSEFLPEPTGEQKKGIRNNCGFEGLTAITESSEPQILGMVEAPLVQDQGRAVRWVKFAKKADPKVDSKAASWSLIQTGTYLVEDLKTLANGVEVFRGVAEVLHLEKDSYLVLERGAVFTKTGAEYSAEIYLWNERTSEKKILVDLGKDLIKKRKNKSVQNFEVLAWGPAEDGVKTLYVIADNNFKKSETTDVLVFKLKP